MTPAVAVKSPPRSMRSTRQVEILGTDAHSHEHGAVSRYAGPARNEPIGLIGSVRDVEILWTGGEMNATLNEHQVGPRKDGPAQVYHFLIG
jgi:hypothetical protein